MSLPKMVKDEDTAYDEVLDDLTTLAEQLPQKEQKIKDLMIKKLQQLRRLIEVDVTE